MRNDLQRIRWDKNMTVEQLARLSGISSSEISRIENNQSSPTLYTMCRLSKALKVNAWEVWSCDKD